ncbi:hypothetical protein E1301_Tti023042 [Triplophysa tibetana]|uniref:exodeoxyribonuclease III n=1 Tax=Triplophysa tibetana TaxID=1572043 RepID=A0A5A9NMH8_9TELE|nr:hypothetical protein E1301_Tti023042 [Triplophysa tibetana]
MFLIGSIDSDTVHTENKGLSSAIISTICKIDIYLNLFIRKTLYKNTSSILFLAYCVTKLDTMAEVNKTELKVISWNVNGMKVKEDRINKLMKKKKFDIVLLQETHYGEKKKTTKVEDLVRGMESVKIRSKSEEEQSASENEEEKSESENEDEEKDLAGGEKKCSESKFYTIKDLITKEIFQEPNIIQGDQPIMYTGNLHSRSSGVAILVNKPHTCLKAYSEGGDFAWVYIDIDGQKYTFVSVYYHENESGLMLRIHQSFLIHEPKAWKESNLVIGGDFNTRLYPVDVKRPNFKNSERNEEVKEFMKVGKLIDVWRQQNEAEEQFTYSCKEHISRLDYVFMLERDYKYVKLQSCVIPYEVDYTISDHYPVVLTTQFKNK